MATAPDRCELLCLDLEVAEALRAEFPPAAVTSGPATRAKALGDPTRLALAVTLAQADELCVCDLAWISGRSENLVSHHLRTLRTAGLVTSRRDGKMVLYRITDAARELLRCVMAVRG
ncbi:MAG: ArsR/SmtB family transcription factor [Solirubrobacteraceae bacterium]